MFKSNLFIVLLSLTWLLFISSCRASEILIEHQCKSVDVNISMSKSDERIQDITQPIYQLSYDFTKAVNDADMEQIANLVTEDAEFWTNGLAPLKGREALVEAFEPFLQQYRYQKSFQCDELIVRDNIAFSRGIEINTKTPRSGGETFTTKQRAFSIMRKGTDGKWRFSRGMTNLPPQDKP